MKEYKLVQIGKGIHLSRDKQLRDAEIELNQYISEGWQLQQVVTPSDGTGDMVAVLYMEVEL